MINRLLLLGALLLAGCSGDPGMGPVSVKWDRDACDRCRMVLSDRHHSAQIRGGPVGEKAKVYLFDDLGCAVIWLDEQPWHTNPAVEIWVNDHTTGEWIDARTAWYVNGQTTPMAYGLGAQREPTAGAIDFAAARAAIYDVERRFNSHANHADAVVELR